MPDKISEIWSLESPFLPQNGVEVLDS